VHAGAARAAVVHLTRTLAVEWAPFGIRLNCLGPAVLTDGMRAEFAESDPTVLDELERRLPGGRWGTPDELAGTALFLCSDASSFVTGELLVMDGGAWAAQGLGMRAISGRRWSTEPDAGARRDWSGSLMGDEPA
jgi:NAD(P)-dependent dehydrogenase (short-subunit alcohol dehydrogenase family)